MICKSATIQWAAWRPRAQWSSLDRK